MTAISGWRYVWTMVFFDLPVKTKKERRAYTQFRKHLLKMGFVKLQFSVYARCDLGEERAAAIDGAVRSRLPPRGEVRLMQITDRQYGRMRVFVGKRPVETEKRAEQLEFF
jgi:CRISPR-associated protein Cas2